MKDKVKKVLRKKLKEKANFSKEAVNVILNTLLDGTTEIIKGINELPAKERCELLHITILNLIKNADIHPINKIGIAEATSHFIKDSVLNTVRRKEKEGLADRIKSMFG